MERSLRNTGEKDTSPKGGRLSGPVYRRTCEAYNTVWGTANREQRLCLGTVVRLQDEVVCKRERGWRKRVHKHKHVQVNKSEEIGVLRDGLAAGKRRDGVELKQVRNEKARK